MKYLATVLMGLLLIPNVSFASELNTAQISAILGLLSAFGVQTTVLDNVRTILIGVPKVTVLPAPSTPQNTPIPTPVIVPTFGNVAAKSPVCVPSISATTSDFIDKWSGEYTHSHVLFTIHTETCGPGRLTIIAPYTTLSPSLARSPNGETNPWSGKETTFTYGAPYRGEYGTKLMSDGIRANGTPENQFVTFGIGTATTTLDIPMVDNSY